MKYLGESFALLSAVSWSISVIFLKKTGQNISSALLTLLKTGIAFLLFLVMFLIFDKFNIPKFDPHKLFLLFISGTFGIAIADYMFVLSIKRLGASLQAIVDCTYSPSIAMIAYLLFGEKINVYTILGGSLVLTAILVVSLETRTQNVSKKNFIEGVFLGVFCHIIMGVAVLFIRDLLRTDSFFWITSVRFGFGFIVLILIYLFESKNFKSKSNFNKQSIFNLLITSLMGPFLSTTFWLLGFKYTKASVAAIYNQMSTFFTVILAYYILKEPLNKQRITGVVLGFLGALIVLIGTK